MKTKLRNPLRRRTSYGHSTAEHHGLRKLILIPAPETVNAWGWGRRTLSIFGELELRSCGRHRKALNSARPVVVGIGAGQTSVGVNRREITTEGGVVLGVNDWGPRDDRVTVIRFEGTAAPWLRLCICPLTHKHE